MWDYFACSDRLTLSLRSRVLVSKAISFSESLDCFITSLLVNLVFRMVEQSPQVWDLHYKGVYVL